MLSMQGGGKPAGGAVYQQPQMSIKLTLKSAHDFDAAGLSSHCWLSEILCNRRYRNSGNPELGICNLEVRTVHGIQMLTMYEFYVTMQQEVCSD